MKLRTELPDEFPSQTLHVSFWLVLTNLLLMVSVQPPETDYDANAEVCNNHLPAYDRSQLHTLTHKPTIWVLIK